MPVQIGNDCRNEADPCLRIGLVNNMTEAASAASERQFLCLLQRASGSIPVSVSLYTLPGMPTPRPKYRSTEALLGTQLDGLIVTGREPLQADLRDEPYWKSFTSLLEWARENTVSTVWSCLAAHAAVLHMDGIRRQRRVAKQFGVFDCAPVSNHPLVAGMRSGSRVPHSRWNALSEEELSAHGHLVLLRSEGKEVDTFVKKDGSLFVFSQGHQEYETDTLLREYRRDVGRYVRNPTVGPPTIPISYFSRATEERLLTLRQASEAQPGEALLTEVAAVLNDAVVENTWVVSAQCMYRNWLQYLVAKKMTAPWNVNACNSVDLSVEPYRNDLQGVWPHE